MSLFFKKGAQVGGRTWDLFDFRLFSLTSSALDHSATAPPLVSVSLCKGGTVVEKKSRRDKLF